MTGPEFLHGTAHPKHQVVVDEIRLQGSRCGPFSVALKLLQMGQVSIEGLISHRFPLDR